MSDGEKMTAQQRAEKIHHMCFEDFHGNTRTELVSRITAEIVEAEREAVIREFEGEDCTVAKLEHEAHVRGYKAGAEAMRERAAAVVIADQPSGREHLAKKILALPVVEGQPMIPFQGAGKE